MKTELVLVRHGETDWNVERRMQGQSGPGLNEKGRQQAQAAIHTLNSTSFAAIYTSDQARALETAQIIGAAMGLTPRIDLRLRERDAGAWQGLLLDDIKRRYPELIADMHKDFAAIAPPGGENLEQVAERMRVALDELSARHPNQRLLIVSHGLSISVVRAIQAGQPINAAFDLRPDNAEVVRLVWPPE